MGGCRVERRRGSEIFPEILEIRGQLHLATDWDNNGSQLPFGAFRETVMPFPETRNAGGRAGLGETVTAFELNVSRRHPWGGGKEKPSRHLWISRRRL